VIVLFAGYRFRLFDVLFRAQTYSFPQENISVCVNTFLSASKNDKKYQKKAQKVKDSGSGNGFWGLNQGVFCGLG
jgi:hypothetical protein